MDSVDYPRSAQMSVFDRWCSAQQRAGPSKPPTTTARGWVHRTHIRLIREVGPRHVTAVMATTIAYLEEGAPGHSCPCATCAVRGGKEPSPCSFLGYQAPRPASPQSIAMRRDTPMLRHRTLIGGNATARQWGSSNLSGVLGNSCRSG